MGDGFVTELFIILVLILANGFFAGAEIAIIAAGRGRLQQQVFQLHGNELIEGLEKKLRRTLTVHCDL